MVTVILAAFQLFLNGLVKLSGLDYDRGGEEVRVFFRVFRVFRGFGLLKQTTKHTNKMRSDSARDLQLRLITTTSSRCRKVFQRAGFQITKSDECVELIAVERLIDRRDLRKVVVDEW